MSAGSLRNEGRACDAVLRVLEHRSSEVRADLRHPEKDGVGPPVDLRVRIGATQYALEHTRVEPFEHEIRTRRLVSRLAGPVERAVSGTLPGEATYQLRLPLDPSLGVRKHELPARIGTLVD